MFSFRKKKKKIDWHEWAKTKEKITGVAGEAKPEGVEQTMKAWFLYFDHNNICKLVRKKVKDGQADIEDKRFHVDLSKPLLLKRGLGFQPLFIIKWSDVYPDGVVNPVELKFMKDNTVNPEMLKKTMSLKIIGNMLKSPREVNWFLMALIGTAFGAFVMYYLVAMKVISF